MHKTTVHVLPIPRFAPNRYGEWGVTVDIEHDIEWELPALHRSGQEFPAVSLEKVIRGGVEEYFSRWVFDYERELTEENRAWILLRIEATACRFVSDRPRSSMMRELLNTLPLAFLHKDPIGRFPQLQITSIKVERLTA